MNKYKVEYTIIYTADVKYSISYSGNSMTIATDFSDIIYASDAVTAINIITSGQFNKKPIHFSESYDIWVSLRQPKLEYFIKSVSFC